MKKLFFIILYLFLVLPCLSEELTLGIIQQRVHAGMSQTEIVSCLGSPDMINKETDGSQTWIYDKNSKSTHSTYNKHWFWILFFWKGKGHNDTVSTQKTLTLIINFDKNDIVQNFSYNTKSF